MKIRLRSQSVRLRLGRSEVSTLARGEAVAEVIRLTHAAKFACELRPQPDADAITHTYDNGRLTFFVPSEQLNEWAATDAVGFSADLSLGDCAMLRLLVEKDFACLDATGDESQADAFPNPSTACVPTSEQA